MDDWEDWRRPGPARVFERSDAVLALAAIAGAAAMNVLINSMGAFYQGTAPPLGEQLRYVLLAAMWAVAGALVSRMEDLGSSSSLVTLLVMLPYLGVTFFQRNDLVLTILSYVPFSAAVAMPVRMFTGEPALWEPVLSLGVLAVTLVACVLVASRLYTGSLLQTGARVRLARAWAGAETP